MQIKKTRPSKVAANKLKLRLLKLVLRMKKMTKLKNWMVLTLSSLDLMVSLSKETTLM